MASNANLRPGAPSGLSRPSSRASQKAPSSAAGRPISSLSFRPVSRVSQRPNSRLSRPPTRQSSRLLPFVQTLVTQITGANVEQDADHFRALVEQASKGLEYSVKAAVGIDMTVVDRQVRGHAYKARINSRDEWAAALEESFEKLRTAVQQHTDVDQEIKLSTLPNHLQFLMTLSEAPSSSTLVFAKTLLENLRNPPKPPPSLTWKDILEGDPYQGQHWEGAYGLPPGSTLENWDVQSDESTPSLDDSDDLEDTHSILSSSEELDKANTVDDQGPTISTPPEDNVQHLYHHRKEFEEFRARQYWRPEWQIDADVSRPFDIGDASTLGPSFQRIAHGGYAIFGHGIDKVKYINELDAVREVLMALQGRKTLLMVWNEETSAFEPASDGPRVLHLTPSSFTSLMLFFARHVTSVERLRKFSCQIFAELSKPTDKALHSRRNTRTLEAFADAVDQEIRSFDNWCAQKEEDICRVKCGGSGPSITVSLLSLEKAVQDTYSQSFDVLLDVLRQVVNRALPPGYAHFPIWNFSQSIAQSAPANVTANLLDSLTQTVQDQSSMGNKVTSEVLMRVFTRSAEPVWAMVGRWLKDGMPVRDPGEPKSCGGSYFDDEFFIEDNDMLLVDPDFWKEGYTLRDGAEEGYKARAVPIFLEHVAEHILGTGKAVGLLRALGISLPENDQIVPLNWPLFSSVLAQEGSDDTPLGLDTRSYAVLSLSIDRLSRVVYDVVLPYCETTGARLTKSLVEDFDALQHLASIEDLYLMRKGDSMSHFTDVLFAKMDANQSWTDFHFLNTAFSDVVEATSAKWIKPSLVRLSYRGNKDKAVNRTVRSIEGLLAEYAVPFPLTFIFGSRVLQVYGSVFVFLLQIRRAKGVLERILVRGTIANAVHDQGSLKAFYAMRSKLSWFVNTLLNFLTTYVIHAQVLKFRKSFSAARSLDEIIQLHDDHIDKIQGRCLLRSNTSSLHRAIMSILDICLHFADFFVTFAGDTTLDISRQSITIKRHRSRRQRRLRRDIIGFSQSLRDARYSSDDDDSDVDEAGEAEAPESSFTVGSSFISTVEEEGPTNRLDKMSSELDGLVRFIRRGVESLAGGMSEAASAFGVLAFALEDWDT